MCSPAACRRIPRWVASPIRCSTPSPATASSTSPALVFHELAHQVAYLPGDSAFNEAFATAVEEAGVRPLCRDAARCQPAAALAAATASAHRNHRAHHESARRSQSHLHAALRTRSHARCQGRTAATARHRHPRAGTARRARLGLWQLDRRGPEQCAPGVGGYLLRPGAVFRDSIERALRRLVALPLHRGEAGECSSRRPIARRQATAKAKEKGPA